MTVVWTFVGLVCGALLHRYSLRLYDRWWAARMGRRVLERGERRPQVRIEADGSFEDYR